MLNLELFYCKIITQTPPAERFHAIQLVEDVIVINFDCLYDRECAIRGSDQLIYLAHKLGRGKRFLFISEDGSNIKNSGAIEIITKIVNCFNLNEKTCTVICRETLSIPKVTVINNEAIPYWCRVLYPEVKNISIPQGPFKKKFAVWYNRGTYYRLHIARHLFENYRQESFISYQEKGVIVDEALREYFQDDIEWADKHTPIIYDQLFPDRVFDYNLIVGAHRKQYNDYFIEIVAETDILTTAWITEKTVKNLYIGKPFIIMGGANSLSKIKSQGFKTFSPWIDESYDTIENNFLRLEAIKKEIDRIATKSPEELTSMQHEMLSVLTYNREKYEHFVGRR